jgi:hypothetical protein
MTDRPNRKEVIASIIGEIEHYWQTHVFEAIWSQGAYQSGSQAVDIYKFSRGDEPLLPEIIKDQEKFDEALDSLDELVPNENKEACKAWSDLDTLRNVIARNCGEVGYFIGVLMGAKLMGATHEQLEQFGRALDRYLTDNDRAAD